MNSNLIIVGIISLVIGLAGGYTIARTQQPAPMVHTMGSAMADMTAGLEGKNGDAFDEAFLNEMIEHHEGAVAMAHMVLMQSDRPELRQLAEDIISAQTREVQMMHQWKQGWFNN